MQQNNRVRKIGRQAVLALGRNQKRDIKVELLLGTFL